MAQHRRWDEIKRERIASPEVQAAYDAAGRAIRLGEEVRRLREARGWTQAELARRMGARQPFIARLELGGVEPKLETLQRVGDALGAEVVIEFRQRETVADPA